MSSGYCQLYMRMRLDFSLGINWQWISNQWHNSHVGFGANKRMSLTHLFLETSSLHCRLCGWLVDLRESATFEPPPPFLFRWGHLPTPSPLCLLLHTSASSTPSPPHPPPSFDFSINYTYCWLLRVPPLSLPPPFLFRLTVNCPLPLLCLCLCLLSPSQFWR